MENTENEPSDLTPEQSEEINTILLGTAKSVLVKTDDFQGEAISYFEFPADIVLRVGMAHPSVGMAMSKQMLELAMLSPLDAQTVAGMSFTDFMTTLETWVDASQTLAETALFEKMLTSQSIEGPVSATEDHESIERLKNILKRFNEQ